MKTLLNYQKPLLIALSLMLAFTTKQTCAQNQNLPSLAVLGIESNGVDHDAHAISYMIRLEIEKLNTYYVMDKYDVAEIADSKSMNIADCFGKSCVTQTGKVLNASKVIAGSVERFGKKIIISLKLYDVSSGNVENQSAIEFLNLQTELQRMIRVSIKKLLGFEADSNVEDLLMHYDVPIENPKTKLTLNGPRMGFSVPFGTTKSILMDEESEGGFGMFPAMFQFGWQQEIQYLSAGKFQALIEGILLLGGLESGRIVPSFSLINGFRFGDKGWEFGFGPSFRWEKVANGFYGDGENGTVESKWYLENEWSSVREDSDQSNPYPIGTRLDSRGETEATASLIFAVGRTFKSGYLNIPFNAYISPRKNGTVVGFSFGFNIRKDNKQLMDK